MKAILFPTDFSDLATNAFIYAVHLAKNIDAKLYILHTYLPPVLSSTHAGHPESLPEVYDKLQLSAFERFQKEAPILKEIAKKEEFDLSNMFFIFEEGEVASVIKNISKKEKIHLIVMATHGQTGFLDRIIGTNTMSVIKTVKTPILAIPPHAQFDGINRVVFTSLFKDSDIQPLRQALIMASEVNATTECIHVINSPDISNERKKMELWKEELGRYDVDFKFLDKVESIENTITNYILENNIDILAVIKRNRNFFEKLFNTSTTNNLTFHTKVPIMVYHEE